ncbi:hypothetical protein Tco_0204710 [Tanacetum coccineum]
MIPITQFWSTASLRSSELGPPAIMATIDGTSYTITESFMRKGKIEPFIRTNSSPPVEVRSNTLYMCLSTKSGSWDHLEPLAIALIFVEEGKTTISGVSEISLQGRLNFHGDHMPLVAAMLPPPQAAIAAGTSGEAHHPNPQPDHATVTKPVHQTKGPSSDPHVESSSKANDSNPDPTVADDPLGGSFFASPSRSTAAPHDGCDGEIGKESEDFGVKTQSKGKECDFNCNCLLDTFSVLADAAQRPKFPPISTFPTDAFVHGNAVPTGTASNFSADPSNKEAARKLYEEEQAELAREQEEMKKKRQEEHVELTREQEEIKKKRQEDVINSAKHALDHRNAQVNLRRSLKRPGADVEQPGSKKSKSSAAPQTPVPAAFHLINYCDTPDLHQLTFC